MSVMPGGVGANGPGSGGASSAGAGSAAGSSQALGDSQAAGPAGRSLQPGGAHTESAEADHFLACIFNVSPDMSHKLLQVRANFVWR